MRTAEVTHVGFSDESNWNKGRFQHWVGNNNGCGSDDLNRKLTQTLLSRVSGLKWQKLRQARESFVAEDGDLRGGRLEATSAVDVGMGHSG